MAASNHEKRRKGLLILGVDDSTKFLFSTVGSIHQSILCPDQCPVASSTYKSPVAGGFLSNGHVPYIFLFSLLKRK